MNNDFYPKLILKLSVTLETQENFFIEVTHDEFSSKLSTSEQESERILKHFKTLITQMLEEFKQEVK